MGFDKWGKMGQRDLMGWITSATQKFGCCCCLQYLLGTNVTCIQGYPVGIYRHHYRANSVLYLGFFLVFFGCISLLLACLRSSVTGFKRDIQVASVLVTMVIVYLLPNWDESLQGLGRPGHGLPPGTPHGQRYHF